MTIARIFFVLFGAAMFTASLSAGLAYLEFRWRQMFVRHKIMAGLGWLLAGAIAVAVGLFIAKAVNHG